MTWREDEEWLSAPLDPKEEAAFAAFEKEVTNRAVDLLKILEARYLASPPGSRPCNDTGLLLCSSCGDTDCCDNTTPREAC